MNRLGALPVDQVRAMKAKGFDNNQIVQALQRNGYSSTQIFDALNQSDLNSGMPGFSEPPPFSGSQIDPNIAGQGEPIEPAPVGGVSVEEIEELVESVIEEKWDLLSKDIGKVVDWKNDVELKIAKIEQRFDSLKDDFDKLHQAIIGKIGDYDRNILEVGAEIKAMEKVFSKVLPLFTENVAELARITQNMKKKPV